MKKPTKFYKFEDLINFINNQHDDRLINMHEIFGDECGCVLIHFGRHLSHRKIKQVGYAHIIDDRHQKYEVTPNEYADTYNLIDMFISNRIQNYGQAKKLVKKYLESK